MHSPHINLSQIKKLSHKYNLPTEDVMLIALNTMGVQGEKRQKRLRFKLTLSSSKKIFYLAVCVNTQKTPFTIKENYLLLEGKKIGKITEIENDTCDSTYFRRNNTVLNINSNSRSNCRGCKFCGTYSQDINDRNNLLNQDRFRKYIKSFLLKNKIRDFSRITEVAICTGCFISEEKAAEHMLMIREALKDFGFEKEIKYIGSQLTSKKNFEKIQQSATPFSFYLTLESFTRRKELLRKDKADISFPKAKKILNHSMEKNFSTTFLYILGIDSLETITEKFKEISPYINRFPIINLFQIYSPEQKYLLHPEVRDIEYYLKARKNIEKIFKKTNLRPRPWENYRSLWYTQFGTEKIRGIRI